MRNVSPDYTGLKEKERRASDPEDVSSSSSPRSSASRPPPTDAKEKLPEPGVTRTTSGTLSDNQVENELVDILDEHVDGGIEYKTLSWFNCGVLMIAECISLGILSLPNVMATIGLVGGLLLIIILGIVAGYTGYVIGQFKLAYPDCHDMGEAGRIMFGPIGREVLGLGQYIVLLFIMAAHINSFTVMMNVLTGHATCSITFSIVALVLSIGPTCFRTLKGISYFSIASCLSIIIALIIVMIGVGVVQPGRGQVEAFQTVPLTSAMTSVLNIILAYSGHVTYFTFASELREPRDFTKSLVMLQTNAIALYTTAAVVIYYYVGNGVPALALSAASPAVAKAAYGVASVTIIIAGVVNGSVVSKALYLRIWSATKVGPRVIKECTLRAYSSWFAIVVTVWVVAWVIAEGIPSFKHLLALVAALFSGWYSYGVTGLLWLFMNWGNLASSRRKIALSVLNATIILMGAVICGLGLYATGTEIHQGKSGKPFSCEDNSPYEMAITEHAKRRHIS